jgi:hypothetical protein
MIEQDEEAFFKLIGSVYSFYRRDFSDFAGGVWLAAMKPFDYAAVEDAIGRHSVNPDTGRFMPMPADIVQMLQGTTIDSALVAWSKVDRGVRVVGPWRSVAFDDPLIHAVITEMGGWTALGNKEETDWPFLKNEFSTRYRGYRSRSLVPEYPPVLIGIAAANNAREGQIGNEPPTLIGNPKVAQDVMLMGSNKPMLAITQMDPKESAATLRLVDSRTGT